MIVCDNKERGCKAAVKIEELQTHLASCDFDPLECAGCGLFVNRGELADHQLNCDVIKHLIFEDVQESETPNVRGNGVPCSAVAHLAGRIITLENDLKQVRRDLHLADHRNKQLERELRRTRKSLEDKRQQLAEEQYIQFDPDYDYGFTPDSIVKLSTFLAKYLSRKPMYVDTTRVFCAVKRCYDNYGHSGDRYKEEIHMLLATAYASNWFTRSQRISMHCWMQALFATNALFSSS
jgi:hypothetical protein